MRQSELIAIFDSASAFVEALKGLQQAGLRQVRAYSPVGLPAIEPLLATRGSPVRFLTLAGAVAGGIAGLWMCVGSASIYSIIVGGKLPTALLPYYIIGFELTILLGGLAALASVIVLARLWPRTPTPDYDVRFGVDRFGISVKCTESQAVTAREIFRQAGAEEVRPAGPIEQDNG